MTQINTAISNITLVEKANEVLKYTWKYLAICSEFRASDIYNGPILQDGLIIHIIRLYHPTSFWVGTVFTLTVSFIKNTYLQVCDFLTNKHRRCLELSKFRIRFKKLWFSMVEIQHRHRILSRDLL